MPHPSYLLVLTPSDFFWLLFPQWNKSSKGNIFANVEAVKQKTAEPLKGIKIDKFKNYSEQWKNILIRVLHQMESTLKVTEV